MLETIFVIILLLCVVYLCFWWINSPAETEGDLPPAYPGALPVIGHAHLMVGDGKYLWSLIEKVQKHCLENGGVTHIKLGNQLHYVICDSDDYLTVMDHLLEKNSWYLKILSPWIGTGLVSAPVSIWKRQQKLLYPSFGQNVVDGFMGVHNSHARSLVKSLRDKVNKEPFEHLNYIARSALEANFLTAFGLELDKKTMREMKTYMDAFVEIRRVLTERIQKFWMQNDFVYRFTELKKRQDAALKITRSLTFDIIKRKRAAIQNKSQTNDTNGNTNSRRFKGFMDLILDLSAENALSDEDIKYQVTTMILAGYDTSSTTTTYACLMLGSYPDVQEKVYQELQDVFGGTTRDVQKEDISRLVYLDAVIKEVGRLFPAAPITGRYVDKDVKLKNYTLKAGNNCSLILNGVNRDRNWGADREQFRPERWLDPTTLPDHAIAFTGFSTGRRACIGKPYAVNYMKITLSHILRHYKIVADASKLVLRMEIFLKPAEGCLISLLPRSVTM